MRLAYLFSRHPVVSQTFCDSEIAALRDHGLDPLVVSLHPPPNSLRHEHLDLRRGPTHYAPPSAVSKILEARARRNGSWPEAMIARHLADYGADTAPALRARNALYCADLFTRRDVRHFHVHFAGHAAHTALFIHHLTGIPFSVTPHSQDFQSDQPSLGLLREILETAAFTVAPSRFSQDLLARLARAAHRVHRTPHRIQRLPPPHRRLLPPATTRLPLRLRHRGRRPVAGTAPNAD